MKESALYIPVREWLRDRGYRVHVEMFDADVIAIKDSQITVVELKLGFNDGLCRQLQDRSKWADFVYAAIPPNAADANTIWGSRKTFFARYGFGLLIVDGNSVKQRRKPFPQPFCWHKKRAYRMKRLLGSHPACDFELAGLKCGPELRAQRNGVP